MVHRFVRFSSGMLRTAPSMAWIMPAAASSEQDFILNCVALQNARPAMVQVLPLASNAQNPKVLNALIGARYK